MKTVERYALNMYREKYGIFINMGTFLKSNKYNTNDSVIKSNRCKSIFEKSFTEIKNIVNDEFKKVYFCYFDQEQKTNDFLELLEKEGIDQNKIYRPIKNIHTFAIDDKRQFVHEMVGCNCVPRTYLAYKDFDTNRLKYAEDKIWFIKSRGGSGGKGVYCKTTKELVHDPGRNYVIQEEITPIDLWQNRKYVIRSYILIWNKRVWLHKKAIAVIHGEDYSQSNCDHNVQVSHEGYHNEKGDVKIHPLENIMDLTDHPTNTHDMLLREMYEVSKVIADRFDRLVQESNECEYIILGVDFLPIKKINRKYGIKIVEVNRYPNMFHTELINRHVNERVIRDTMYILFGVDEALGHDYISVPTKKIHLAPED